MNEVKAKSNNLRDAETKPLTPPEPGPVDSGKDRQLVMPDGSVVKDSPEKQRQAERKSEDQDYVPVIIKRTDEKRRHPDDAGLNANQHSTRANINRQLHADKKTARTESLVDLGKLDGAKQEATKQVYADFENSVSKIVSNASDPQTDFTKRSFTSQTVINTANGTTAISWVNKTPGKVNYPHLFAEFGGLLNKTSVHQVIAERQLF